MKKKGSESMLLFWKTFGVAMEGSYNEAIRELDALRQKRDIEFPVVVALIYVHNKCSVVDHGEVSHLESSLPIAEDSASDASILLASTFLWHTGNSNEARRLADKLIQSPGDSAHQGQAMTLRGWIDLTSGDSRRERELRDNALQYLDPQTDQARSRDLETLMGRCKAFELKKEYNRALDALNTAIVSYTWYLPALFEKARILMVMGDWEQSLETAQRVLAQDEFDIEALRISVLHQLTREGHAEAAAARISDVIESVDRHEPKNARLYYELSRPFARLAGRSQQVLQLTLTLVDRAQKLEPDNTHYASEAGYQQTLLGEYAAAQESYRMAAKLDESNVAPLHGMIYCQLMEGQLEDAAAQLEFLHVIQDSIGSSAALTHLQALMAWRQQRDAAEHLRLLNQTLELHMASLQPPLLPNTAAYFVQFNPDFLLEIAKELLSHGGSEPLRASDYDAPDSHLNKGLQLLERVVGTVPGLLEAQLTLARAWFVKNNADACTRVLQTCLKLDPSCSAAHLLQAQLALQQENYRAAGASLEHALSLDFAVRTSPVYHCVKAQVLENLGDKEEALQVVEAGMALPGVRSEAFRSSGSGRSGGSGRGPPLVSRHDRVSLFLAHAALLAKADRMKEAQTVVQTAMAEFRNTTEEVRIIVANSELAILNNDFNAAVSMLNAVPQSSPAYVRAQMVKADVYLTHRHNQRMYAQCYQDLVELNPTSQNYVLLGEANMRIQQPDRSITAFQQALRLSPDDSALAAKIGRALVSTHDYLRAIDYYEDALRAAPERQELRHDLARLYTKLKRYDNAVRVLEVALSLNRGRDDASSAQRDVATLRLMFSVQLGMGDRDAAADVLGKARALQSEVVDKLRGEQPELLAAARTEAADICCCLAKHYEQEGDAERAMTHYNEALRHVDSMPGPLMALAKLHLQRGELEQCQQQCMTLRRVDPAHEEAALMLADLMLRKGDHDSAIFHFTQLLEAKSGNFTALSKLLGLLRRAGKLDECPRFIKLAQRSSPRAQHAPGLHFCTGLLARYKNDVHGAVKAFNLARRDAEWGEAAIINMVEMYLNPDNEKMWEESSENNPEVAAAALALAPSASSASPSGESSEAVRVAEKLLRELPTRPKTLKHQVLECYALMATKSRSNIERAVSRFVELLETERDYVPALLGAATAFMMQKQTPKARNQLKRISKMPYNPEMAEEFETSYLVLADMYVARGKYDLAQDLCKRCLGFNRSSAKAWELMGLVMEKEASYRDAAEHYEQAWKFDSETSAPIGYKLAFNYLKAKRYVEAIDVCHKVLAQHPGYQQMQSDILDKARAALRP